MKPIRTAHSNFVWKGPTPEIGDLHAQMDHESQRTRTVWTLSADERIAVAAGANIALDVWGQHPPVDVSVTNEEGVGEDAPRTLLRLEEWRAKQASESGS